MKIATETGLAVLSRMMTFDQNNSQQLFENLRNQTIPPVAETHRAMNAKSIWKSEQHSRKCIAGLGKEMPLACENIRLDDPPVAKRFFFIRICYL